MRYRLRDLLFYSMGQLVRRTTPSFIHKAERLSMTFAGNLPHLGGVWVVRFQDPIIKSGAQVKHIDARLSQFGRFVWGGGHIQGEPNRPFEYRGVIKRNAFYGHFRRNDPHILAGTGTFVLKVAADSKTMKGHCTWYDGLRDNVWDSPYFWNRN